MSYTVQILRRAQKELTGLPLQVYPRARDAIRDLANIPHPAGCKKLTGRNGWRIRVGDIESFMKLTMIRKQLPSCTSAIGAMCMIDLRH